jgi:transcriptional regulator with XRE-family HTH domain
MDTILIVMTTELHADTFDGYSESALLETLGARLKAWRLRRDITQAELAERAGVSRRTIQSLEDGGSVQLGTFLRVARELGLLDGLDTLVPEPGPSPLELLDRGGAQRQRASGQRRDTSEWTWGDEP